jgi:hypothetical protein
MPKDNDVVDLICCERVWDKVKNKKKPANVVPSKIVGNVKGGKPTNLEVEDKENRNKDNTTNGLKEGVYKEGE